jgi:predicted phage tail protein
MNTTELIEQLDQRYGNVHAKECALIQEAIKMLRMQQEEIKALMEQVK